MSIVLGDSYLDTALGGGTVEAAARAGGWRSHNKERLTDVHGARIKQLV